MLSDSQKLTDGLIIYSALISDFEKLDFKNDALAGVRANYFNSNKGKYSLGICFTDGYASLYNINPFGKFCWVITSNGDQNQKYPGYKICIPKIIE